jgi:hypothetical protein
VVTCGVAVYVKTFAITPGTLMSMNDSGNWLLVVGIARDAHGTWTGTYLFYRLGSCTLEHMTLKECDWYWDNFLFP